MLFVQETKLENIDKYAIQRIWGNGDMDFVRSNAIGSSGGLLTIWRKDFFQVDNVISHRSFILMHGKINNAFPCTVVNVYAPNDVVNRRVV